MPADPWSYLPTANTSISRLYLPMYSSKQLLTTELLQAVTTKDFRYTNPHNLCNLLHACVCVVVMTFIDEVKSTLDGTYWRTHVGDTPTSPSTVTSFKCAKYFCF